MVSILERGGIGTAGREAKWIVEAAAGAPAARLWSGDDSPDEEVTSRALGMARRRSEGMPLQYVTGRAGFRYLELSVGPGVLIPRPETEVVAGRAMEHLPREGTLVDVGTGSGAIALSVAQERPDARVLATERHPAALVWAERNRAELGLDVALFRGDLLEELPTELRGLVDVVVANPPYIGRTEIDALPAEVMDHEPHEALFSGASGHDLLKRIIAEAAPWLAPDGWLVLEIAPPQAAAVMGWLRAAGYRDVAVRRDLTGRLRVAEGRRGSDEKGAA